MQDQSKKNTENEELRNDSGSYKGNSRETAHTSDNSGSDSLNYSRRDTSDDSYDDDADTDKYLAMEQPGVAYTKETDPTVNSDQLDFNEQGGENKWDAEGGNSKNSEAFNQDDYILNDNVDLDEDQNQSISTDDEDFEESNERY